MCLMTCAIIGLVALAHFSLGGLWYSQSVFGKVWRREMGIGDAPSCGSGGCSMCCALSVALILSIVHTSLLAGFILHFGVKSALMASVAGGAVVLGFGLLPVLCSHCWSKRSLRVVAIDYGYDLLAIVLAAVALVRFL